MLTNTAIHHLRQRSVMITKSSQDTAPYSLNLDSNARLERASRKFPATLKDISAEASSSLIPINALRKTLAERTRPTVQMTVNDLLVLSGLFSTSDMHPVRSLTLR